MMTEATHDPPALEYERERESRGTATLGWLRRLLVCWLIFQLIMAVNVFNQMVVVVRIFDVSWSEAVRASGVPRQIGMSPGALLMALFAGWAGVVAVRNRSVLPRRWFVIGLVPWGLLVAQGTVSLVAMWW